MRGMFADGPDLVQVSYALALFAYGALALRLALTGYLRRQAGSAAHVFLVAIVCSAAWGAIGWIDTLSRERDWQLLLAPADLARYAAWFAFLLVLLRPALGGRGSDARWMRPVAQGVVLLGALSLVVLAANPGESARRWALFAAMAQPVCGLMLVEQLFRNIERDGRWGAKPLCLGLAGLFAYDIYIHSQAVLFGTFDEDAFGIRAGIHTLAVPLLFIAARRQGEWRARLQVSHRAAFYSATMLLAGAYLVFVAGIGYYVRFFGGSWGRALQLALLFSALVFLAMVVLSGELRSRLRVFVSKNFFAYRYDYREQWLRFTAMLSAPASPQEMGTLVAQGLADLVDSTGASLWVRSASEDRYVESTWTDAWCRPCRRPPMRRSSASCAPTAGSSMSPRRGATPSATTAWCCRTGSGPRSGPWCR